MFQGSAVSGGLRRVNHRRWSEEHQGPQSPDVAEPIPKRQPHRQDLGDNLGPDVFGLAEPVVLSGVERRPPPSEAAAEPALAVARLVQGDGLRGQEASAGRPPQPGKRASGVVFR